MGWGHGGSSASRMTYKDCVDALKTARNKDAGKPMQGGIRVFDRGGHYAVQQYSTDIVRYYEDGSIAICTGWTSASTLSCIAALTGKHVGYRDLPLFNSRKAYPHRTYVIGNGWRDAGVVFNSVGSYIRYDPDGQVDMATVKPVEVDTITDISAVRQGQKKAKAICDQLVLRNKLGVTGGRKMLTFNWLKDNIFRQLEDINYDVQPVADPHKVYKGEGHWFAKEVGATKVVRFKSFNEFNQAA